MSLRVNVGTYCWLLINIFTVPLHFNDNNIILLLFSVNLQGCQVHLPIFPIIEVDELLQFNTHEKVSEHFLIIWQFNSIVWVNTCMCLSQLGRGGGAPRCFRWAKICFWFTVIKMLLFLKTPQTRNNHCKIMSLL